LLRIRWWREKKGKEGEEKEEMRKKRERTVCLVEWTEGTVVVAFTFYLFSRRRGNNALND